MEAIFDTLFGNILVLLAIVGGVLGFFKDKNAKEQDSNKPYAAPKANQTSQDREERTAYEEVPYESQSYASSTIARDEQTDTSDSVEIGIHDALPNRKLNAPTQRTPKNSHLKKQISHNLTKQGLLNGIIMNEVLGPPRATKPYKSVTGQRRK
ncbi:hypothetical protein VBD025_10460 [Virgibacillus flavescens]|uniref:hypothetical protein n=1 Tax=Virgibacillus flavescens TaxID=1611422 RepID=UPI003D349314